MLRGVLYMLARFLGDLNAILTGRVGRRVKRRTVGRFTSKLIRKF